MAQRPSHQTSVCPRAAPRGGRTCCLFHRRAPAASDGRGLYHRTMGGGGSPTSEGASAWSSDPHGPHPAAARPWHEPATDCSTRHGQTWAGGAEPRLGWAAAGGLGGAVGTKPGMKTRPLSRCCLHGPAGVLGHSRASRCLPMVGGGRCAAPAQKLDGHFPELRPPEQGHPQH